MTPRDTSNAPDARQTRPQDPGMTRHARSTHSKGVEMLGQPHFVLPRGNFDGWPGFLGAKPGQAWLATRSRQSFELPCNIPDMVDLSLLRETAGR